MHHNRKLITSKELNRKIVRKHLVEEKQISHIHDRKVQSAKTALRRRKSSRAAPAARTYELRTRTERHRTGVVSLGYKEDNNFTGPMSISDYLRPSKGTEQPRTSSRNRASLKPFLTVSLKDTDKNIHDNLQPIKSTELLGTGLPKGETYLWKLGHSGDKKNDVVASPRTQIPPGEQAKNQTSNKYQEDTAQGCEADQASGGRCISPERTEEQVTKLHEEPYEYTVDRRTRKKQARKRNKKQKKGSRVFFSVSVQTEGSFTFGKKANATCTIGVGTRDLQCDRVLPLKKRVKLENGGARSKEWIPYTDGRVKQCMGGLMGRSSRENSWGEVPWSHIPNHSGKGLGLNFRRISSDAEAYNPPMATVQSPLQSSNW